MTYNSLLSYVSIGLDPAPISSSATYNSLLSYVCCPGDTGPGARDPALQFSVELCTKQYSHSTGSTSGQHLQFSVELCLTVTRP